MPDSPADRWDPRYRRRLEALSAGVTPDDEGPHPFLIEQAAVFDLEGVLPAPPRRGRALDIAAGLGRNAIWLARHGCDVVAVDASRVAGDHLVRRAAELGLPIDVIRCNLETEPLPAGPFDVIVTVNYLQRSLVPPIEAALGPGGLLLFVTMLEGGTGPPPEHREYQLRRGELETLFPALEVLACREDPTGVAHPQASLAARKPA